LPATIIVAGRSLPVITIRRPGTRAIRLRANSVQGAIQLSLPPRGGTAEALRLLESHEGWLAAQVAKWPGPRPIRPGATIPFDGEELLIDWHPAFKRTPVRRDSRLEIGGPETLLAARTLRWLKGEALDDLTASTRRFAAQVDREVAQVRVGDPASRWGSCSAPGRHEAARIAYSWRLILAPAFVRDNVVAHEVAHLVHLNHGPAFHALHASLDPNTAQSKRWLARHGAALHWVGRE
jgi:predicted metal-dependent hydrolase